MLFSIGLCYHFWLPRGEGACGRRGRLSRDIDNLIWRLTLGVLAIMIFVGSAGTSRADTTPKADRFPAQAEHDPLFDELDDTSEEPAAFPDPLEPLNRGTLRLNGVLDRWILDPITGVYSFVVPDQARRAVRRLFANLNSPAVFVNDLLQREWEDAATTAGRFLVNTTAGVGGVFDPATGIGWEAHQSDFGQTLALLGVPSGPYLMVPALGPTTTRDGFGNLVDIFLRPITLVLGPGAPLLFFHTGRVGVGGIVQREALQDKTTALRESSVDYYATLKNAYYQHREANIWARREHHRPAGEETGPTAATESIDSETSRRSLADGANGQVTDLLVYAGD